MIKETLPEEDLNKRLKKIEEVKDGKRSIKDIEERTALPEEAEEYITDFVKKAKGSELGDLKKMEEASERAKKKKRKQKTEEL